MCIYGVCDSVCVWVYGVCECVSMVCVTLCVCGCMVCVCKSLVLTAFLFTALK